MEPERDSCLVEVLDRLLNKGVVLNADLIISVAGIPMIGVNLRAALASIETMLDYGMMEAWDRDTREWYACQDRKIPLEFGEKVFFKAFGYLWHSQGIISNWIPGLWHITNKRLFLWRRGTAEIIFDVPLQTLDAIEARAGDLRSIERIEFELRCGGKTARIYISDSDVFRRALEKAGKNLARIDIASKI